MKLKPGKTHVVVGGQFGSEAKGAVAAFLGRQFSGEVAGVRVGGSNAGHTVLGACPDSCEEREAHLGEMDAQAGFSHPWRLRHVPVLAVTRRDAPLVIAAGSEVDMDVLRNEVEQLEYAGYSVADRLYVDSSATVIELANIKDESETGLVDRLGSTAKGVGSARSMRVWRQARTVGDLPEMFVKGLCMVADTASFLRRWISLGNHVVLEGTQGYGLGLHTRFYPFTTSTDCRAIDFLARAGINPWQTEVHVWVVFRPNPIRVAGNSGPLDDETTWQELGLPEEQTTVTRKTRRVGGWDPDLVNEAIEANGGPGPNVHLVLSMLDHLVPEIRGHEDLTHAPTDVIRLADAHVKRISRSLSGFVELVGTGPRTMMWCQGVAGRTLFGNQPEPTDLTVTLPDFTRMVEQTKIQIAKALQIPQAILAEPGERLPMVTGNELEEWWLNKASAEVKPMVDKALEYGGRGAAIDLIEIGRDLFRMSGRTMEEFTDADATELGIYFYLRGKFGRWQAAILEGRSVSDDTLLDIGVYVRMAQRCREVGGWPYGPEAVDE